MIYTGKSVNSFNPIALRKAKIVYNFGLSECNRVKHQQPSIKIVMYQNMIFIYV